MEVAHESQTHTHTVERHVGRNRRDSWEDSFACFTRSSYSLSFSLHISVWDSFFFAISVLSLSLSRCLYLAPHRGQKKRQRIMGRKRVVNAGEPQPVHERRCWDIVNGKIHRACCAEREREREKKKTCGHGTREIRLCKSRRRARCFDDFLARVTVRERERDTRLVLFLCSTVHCAYASKISCELCVLFTIFAGPSAKFSQENRCPLYSEFSAMTFT